MSFGYLHKSLFLPNLKLKRFYSIIQRERERENERERERGSWKGEIKKHRGVKLRLKWSASGGNDYENNFLEPLHSLVYFHLYLTLFLSFQLSLSTFKSLYISFSLHIFFAYISLSIFISLSLYFHHLSMCLFLCVSISLSSSLSVVFFV